MSMATRAAPIVVAGVAGILVGYLLAPNVSAVREDFAARFNEQTPLIQQLQSSVANIEARVGAMPDADALHAAITEQLAAAEGRLATQTETLGTQLSEQAGTVPEELTSAIEETRTGIEDLRSQVETLSEELSSMREEVAAGAQAPREDEAGRLANEVGASGAVLLAGQAALFGGTRVYLDEIDVEGGTATMTAQGAEAMQVDAGETVEISPTCSLRLAGVAANAAYLAPEDCNPAAGGTQPAAANGDPAAAAAAGVPAPDGQGEAREENPVAPGEEQPDQPLEEEPAANAQVPAGAVPPQGAQAVPDQQPGMQEGNAPNAGEPQGGQPQPAQ